MVDEDELLSELLRVEINKLKSAVNSLKKSNYILIKPNSEQNSILQLQTTEMLSGQAEAIRYKDHFHSFVNLAPACIAVLSGENFILEQINTHFHALFPDRSRLRQRAMRVFPDTHHRPIGTTLKKLFKTGITFEGKELLLSLVSQENGPFEKRYYNFRYQTRFDAKNRVNGSMIFTFEGTSKVSSRVHAEQNERRLHLILNAIPKVIWINYTEGNITFINQRWYDHTGDESMNDINALLFSITHPDDQKEVENRIRFNSSKKAGSSFEFRSKMKNGKCRWLLSRTESIKNEQGKILFHIGKSTDIEEQKQLQRQNDDFIYIASHALRTPLTSLKVAIQLNDERKQELLPSMFIRLMHWATSSMDKIIYLVDDLLNMGRYSHWQLELHNSYFMLLQLLKVYQKISMSNKLLILTGDMDIKLFDDPGRIEQVLINMINNSIKYDRDSKAIRIHLDRRPGLVRISVSDDGPGITPEQIPLLFDKYFRVEHNDYANTGLGLGLYICAEIVRKHGGKIDVISTPKKRASFCFSLPMAVHSLDEPVN